MRARARKEGHAPRFTPIGNNAHGTPTRLNRTIGRRRAQREEPAPPSPLTGRSVNVLILFFCAQNGRIVTSRDLHCLLTDAFGEWVVVSQVYSALDALERQSLLRLDRRTRATVTRNSQNTKPAKQYAITTAADSEVAINLLNWLLSPVLTIC